MFIKHYIIKFILFLGLISYSLNYFKIDSDTTVIIYLTYFLGGLIFLIISYLFKYRKVDQSFKLELEISFSSFIIDFFLFISIYAFYINFIIKKWSFSTPNVLVFIFLILSWFISAILSHQFRYISNYKNIISIIHTYAIDYLIFISSSYFLLNIILKNDISQFFFPLSIYIFWSMILSIYRYLSYRQENTDEVNIKLTQATTYTDILEKKINKSGCNSKYCISDKLGIISEFKKYLKEKYLLGYETLLNFLDENIELNNIDVKDSLVIRSSDIYNIQVLENIGLKFFINLHEINDIRRINEYFIELNNKICFGGIIVGKFEPIKFRYKHFIQTYPRYLAQVFYFFDFIWKRIFPKIPFFKKIYFFITSGKKRVISFSEGLGRLYYCGFEVINLEAVDNYIYFIIKKVKNPSKDPNPSYGPLFKMNRVGKDEKTIKVYKLRTMHPYSEYLQKFTFDLNKLDKGGKIKDDFRITTWGKILRKLWLDELPMLINFFKGELKLVGVRPISKHYLGLYPESAQNLRIHLRPGLIPPFYADIPKTFDEIVESEVKYIHSFNKNHFTTDFQYFFKSAYNILIKGARSG